MEILQFDISGKFAHFRKYYANNTAMSFSIPPRTTLMGILAAMLGLPKDSYYEQLSSDKIRTGIAVKTPIKKTFHRLNLLSIKSKGDLKKSFDSDFRGINGRIQTPFEVVSGYNIQTDELVYRVFVACFDAGKDTFENIKSHLQHQKAYFPTTLGTAQFLASIGNVRLHRDTKECNAQNEWIDFYSAVLTDSVSEIAFEKDDWQNFVEEELMPADFKGNNDRELIKMNRVLFTTNNVPLKVKFTGTYYQLETANEKQVIQFLE